MTKKKIDNINSVNPLYLVIRAEEDYVEAVVGYNDRNLVITSIDNYEIINENKVVIPSSDENKKALSKLNELWNYIESKINGSLENCTKIRFNSNDALPLNTPIKFYALTIVVRCVIMKDFIQKFI